MDPILSRRMAMALKRCIALTLIASIGVSADANAGLGALFKLFKKSDDMIASITARKPYAAIDDGLRPTSLDHIAPRHALSQHQAQQFMSETTDDVFRARPSLLSPHEMPELFQKHPGLSAVINDRSAYRAFVENNPTVLRDASIELYSKHPHVYARALEESGIRISGETFRALIKEQVTSQNTDAAKQLLSRVAASLEKSGFKTDKLKSMEEEVRNRTIEKFINQEIEALVRSSHYKWQYKSGTFSVKGEVGHFSFEHEITYKGLVKLAAVVASGYIGHHLLFETDDFVQIHECIGNFCVRIEKQPVKLVRKTEHGPAKGMEIIDSGAPVNRSSEDSVGGMKFGSSDIELSGTRVQ